MSRMLQDHNGILNELSDAQKLRMREVRTLYIELMKNEV
jgi:hypothetical protein